MIFKRFISIYLLLALFQVIYAENRQVLKIGILAKRGKNIEIQRWQGIKEYLNRQLPQYDLQIIPLFFDEIEHTVKNNQIDFIITNTMNYVCLEKKYGVSRIATIENRGTGDRSLTRFGSVIFTKSTSNIKNLYDAIGKKVGAVDINSFGGWVMAKEEFSENDIKESDFKSLKFYKNHDFVVDAVLNNEVDLGVVRSDILEKLKAERGLDLTKIRVLNKQSNDSFPYLFSTKLYPEWPFAKLKNTGDEETKKVLIELFKLKKGDPALKYSWVNGFTVPLDYGTVHEVLKKLQISPYDDIKISLRDIYQEYKLLIYFILFGALVNIIFVVLLFMMNKRLVKKTKEYERLNASLEDIIDIRTEELQKANEELKNLVETDFLTKVASRRYFFDVGNKYFDLAKRDNVDLFVAIVDLDHFKQVNDKFGHQFGDEVLKEMASRVSQRVRKSDIFSRVGGEEFGICFFDINKDQAIKVCEDINSKIKEKPITKGDNSVTLRLSIGLSGLNSDIKSFDELISKADQALYKAKNSGRDQVVVSN